MAAIVLKRQTGRAHTADITSSDTAAVPGKLVISGTTLSSTEVLRIQGETLLEGTLHGALNGTGLVIGIAGASASTGSALQIGSFTTTQRGNLVATAGMVVYNATDVAFEGYNGTTWTTLGGTVTNTAQATVDFGFASANEGDVATATISASWAQSTTVFTCSVQSFAADHDPEDVAVEGILARVTNIVAGVSFDVMAYAPQGSWGRYTVNVQGI